MCIVNEYYSNQLIVGLICFIPSKLANFKLFDYQYNEAILFIKIQSNTS